MKKCFSIILALCAMASLVLPASAVTIGPAGGVTQQSMLIALIIMCVISVILLLCSVLFAINALTGRKSKRRRRNPVATVLRIFLYIVTVLVIACTVLCFVRYCDVTTPETPSINTPTEPSETEANTTEATEAPTEPSIEETTAPTEPPKPLVFTLSPAMTENSDPANWNVKWQLQANGEIIESYQSNDTYNFLSPDEYYCLPGVPTFRGDNYRSGAAYGTADITSETLTKVWTQGVGSLNGWPGIGWTGQPLCVQWDEETKALMNLYPEKKAKEGLIEVIATTLDGNIYFYDMEDGSYTRDPLWMGMGFKGTASLDPRGYPILYAGSGLINGSKHPRMYAVSLIDCTLLMEHNGADSFALRGWYAFDSSPMISGETDTIFWPCESGVIYSIKLNTQYDKTTGALSMSPETLVKTRYSTSLNRTIGYEASSIIVGQYMFVGDNGGMFYCIDLQTMALVWAQNVGDDVNATPIFEWGEDGQGYLYVATSTEHSVHTSFIYKLNASTGEFIWSKTYDDVAYDYDVSGGALSSPVLGKKGTDLEGLIIFTISKTPSAWSGTMVALDTETGDVVWEKTLTNYAWSSPVGIYTDAGKGYLVLGDSVGYIYLIDGKTGEILATEGLGSNIEASPVVFNNMLVVGTRGCQVYGIEIN